MNQICNSTYFFTWIIISLLKNNLQYLIQVAVILPKHLFYISDSTKKLEDDLKKAEEGDIESQLTVGRYFLTQANVSEKEKREEYAQKAVHWLVEASRQGNDDATEELRNCLDNETGKWKCYICIRCYNIHVVSVN